MITKILKKGKNSTISSLFAGIVVIMAMFMSVACEKDETSVADQQQSVRKPQPISDMEVMQYLPEVVDGRLVFKDDESYEILINWISVNQADPEKIVSLFSNISFTSMNSIYNKGYELLQLTPNISEDEALNNVALFNDYMSKYPHVFYPIYREDYVDYKMQSSNIISYIANEFGLFQIGDNVFRISYNKSYEITDGDFSKISLIVNDKGDVSSKNGIIVNEFSNLSTKEETKQYPAVYFDDRHRFIVSFHLSYTNNQYYYDLQVRGQEKIGFWFNGHGVHAICQMNQSSSYWRIGSTTYNWDDANIWKYTFDHYNKQFTVIKTPSNTAITFSLSYMPYEVACRDDSSDPYSYWNCLNVFGNGEGWNN